MEVITLNRQKGMPVSFNGEILAESSTREDDGDRKYRWWSAKICRNDDKNGMIRVGIGWLTTFSDTERHKYWMDDVFTLKDALKVVSRTVTDMDDANILVEDLKRKLNMYGGKN